MSPLQHQRASEGAARRRTAQQQYPRTTVLRTTRHTRHRARACGTAHCSLAPVLPWPRALHTSHRLLQSCDRPQPPTVICIPFDSSEPSPPLLSPAKARPCLTLLLNQTLCKLSPLPFGVRRWFDYVAAVGLARSPVRTACKELQQVLQLPACSGIQSAGSASASHLQAGRKKPQLALKFVLYTATTRARSLTQPLLHRCLPLATSRSAKRALDVHQFSTKVCASTSSHSGALSKDVGRLPDHLPLGA